MLYEILRMQWSREGDQAERPLPPKQKKIVVEKWYYLPEVYTCGEDAEITENFTEKLWKSQIFNRDFDQKIPTFLFLVFISRFYGRAHNAKAFLKCAPLDSVRSLVRMFCFDQAPGRTWTQDCAMESENLPRNQGACLSLKRFQDFGLFCSKLTELHARFLDFPARWKPFIISWLSCIFQQIHSIFSK